MTLSIKEIARLAGVSHSTVSRALSDSLLIRAETKSRIRRLTREMGCSPLSLESPGTHFVTICRAESTRRQQPTLEGV